MHRLALRGPDKDKNRSSGVAVSAPPVEGHGTEELNKAALANFCTSPKWDPWNVSPPAEYFLWSGWMCYICSRTNVFLCMCVFECVCVCVIVCVIVIVCECVCVSRACHMGSIITCFNTPFVGEGAVAEGFRGQVVGERGVPDAEVREFHRLPQLDRHPSLLLELVMFCS